MIVIGFDPSTSPNLALVCSTRGWLAYADEDQTSVAVSKTKRRPVAGLVAEVLRGWHALDNAALVVGEKIGAWTGQGLLSSAEFVGAMMLVEGVAAGVGLRYDPISPVAWRRAAGLKAGQDKDASRARAAALWPHRAAWLARKKDHNRAEAALIAYGWIEAQR